MAKRSRGSGSTDVSRITPRMCSSGAFLPCCAWWGSEPASASHPLAGSLLARSSNYDATIVPNKYVTRCVLFVAASMSPCVVCLLRCGAFLRAGHSTLGVPQNSSPPIAPGAERNMWELIGPLPSTAQ